MASQSARIGVLILFSRHLELPCLLMAVFGTRVPGAFGGRNPITASGMTSFSETGGGIEK